jgi:hypothetical protein
MWVTVALGAAFLVRARATSTRTPYRDLNLKLVARASSRSTFFMLTGFHGFHVFVGMLMLVFITLRIMKGHFTPQRHFGFEGGGLVLALRGRGVAGPAPSSTTGSEAAAPQIRRRLRAALRFPPRSGRNRNARRADPAPVTRPAG